VAAQGVLVTVCDIPFFPGKMGVDFFNLRALARQVHVGVVGPCYDVLPVAGVANLRKNVGSCYFWPEPIPGQPADARPGTERRLPLVLRLLPRPLKRWLLGRLIGAAPGGEEEQLVKLAILANLAPYVLRALEDRSWEAQVLIQSDVGAWLDYLPPHLPLATYFHDVRSDYLERRAPYERNPASFRRAAQRATQQERAIAGRAEAIGFVSELDRRRAEARLGPLPHAQVCEIPLDLDYYASERARTGGDSEGLTGPQAGPVVGRPELARRSDREVGEPAPPRVLFTGLLAHPPNRDAVLFFLSEVWPLVRAQCPQAAFEVVGAFPSEDLVAACRASAGVSLQADVPDIRPYFRGATVYVVPMRFGGGVRQKVLEAWALRVPVVLTRMASEGSGAQDGLNCLIADEPEDLARRVVELLRRPWMAAALEREGLRYVTERHALDVATPQFQQLVRAAIDRRRARPCRVVFDATWLSSDGPPATAAYLRRLLLALAQLGTPERYGLLATRSTLAQLDLPTASGIRRLATDDWRERARVRFAGLANGLAQALATHVPFGAASLRLRALNRLGADLLHRFEGAPEGDLDRVPQVRTLLREPAAVEREHAGDLLERRACSRAAAVICGSEALRGQVVRRWELDPERVFVVPVGDEREQAQRTLAIYNRLHQGGLAAR